MKRRYTGASQETRIGVMMRANYRCEICGGSLMGVDGMSIHHRKPRGMGGTIDVAINNPSNLMAICGSGTTGCHGWLESHREVAYEKGWLVHRYDDPAKVPAELDQGVRKATLFLTDDFQYAEVEHNPS